MVRSPTGVSVEGDTAFAGFSGGKLDEYFSRHGAEKPEQAVDLLIQLLLAVPLSAKSRDGLIDICRANPNRARGCAEAIHVLATMPEELRRDAVLSLDDDAINALPPAMAAEAASRRRHQTGRSRADGKPNSRNPPAAPSGSRDRGPAH
jgi:hypothetical protein